MTRFAWRMLWNWTLDVEEWTKAIGRRYGQVPGLNEIMAGVFRLRKWLVEQEPGGRGS